jgi:hypothetical protein
MIVTTGHCSVWLDGCHSQPVPYSNNTGCPIDVCQQEQLETVWNQRVLSQGVIKRPLLADRHRRTRLAWCLARRGWNLRTWCKINWLSNGLGVYLSWLQAGFSHHTRQPNWWSVHQRRLATSCCPPFWQPPTCYKTCLYGWQRRASSFKSSNAYLQSEAVTSVPWPAMSPDLNPIEHIWDMLGRRIQAREPPVQNIRQLEAALHREWQQLSQQDIRRLTGGMRRRVEAVIQARGGYTWYWTLNNSCRQVIHKWRFEREMTILSCFLNCEDQYLKWTCFTAKTGLVILGLNIH